MGCDQERFALKAIAQKLNRKVGTIKAHLFFAREKLQSQLRPYLRCEPCEEGENRGIISLAKSFHVRYNLLLEVIKISMHK